MFLPQKIIDEIPFYKNNLAKFLSGELEEAFFRGVRVPWGFYSQRGGEFLMARLRVPNGILTPRQLYEIGTVASTHANGKLHITTRQDIQIHNLPVENSLKIIESLQKIHISPRGGGGNTIRNITGCYLSGICPHEHSEVYKNVWGLTEYLLSCDESYAMPRKIKIAFSGCEHDCACTGVNDLGFVALKDGGFKVLCGGGMGAKSAVGTILHEKIDQNEIGYVARAIVNLFIKYGDRKRRNRNRLRFLIQKLGWEAFHQHYKQELAEAHKGAPIDIHSKDELPALSKAAPSTSPEEAALDDTGYASFLKHHCSQQKQSGYYSIVLRVPRGEIAGDTLIALSKLSDTIPALHFRTTQRQDMIIANVPQEKLNLIFNSVRHLFTFAPHPEAITDTVCCKGATTCNIGICNSVGLVSAIVEELHTISLKPDRLKDLTININGCPNACGQHPIGLISFSGMVKKVNNRSVPFYRVHLGGRIDAENTRLAEPLGAVPARIIPKMFTQFLTALQESPQENAHDFVSTQGKQAITELIQQYATVPPYEEDTSFYMDYGKTEEFSLDGLSQAECSSGVVDMIESDLASAQHLLTTSREKGFDLDALHHAFISASRALLVVKGVDPKDEPAIIDAFISKFVDTHIVPSEFSNIHTVYDQICARSIKKETAYDYTNRLYEAVKETYSLMDSTFNFPARF
jgi:sulfite reductase (ferredoxin)